MADSSERLAEMFPKLTATQIARLLPVGRRRRFAAGEVIYERGSAKRAFYVLLEGRVEIAGPSRVGEERLTVHETGEFTGEVDMISGRQSLVGARALGATELLEIDLADLRHIVQTDTELSELFLRAFVLRRAYLIANTVGGARAGRVGPLGGYPAPQGLPGAQRTSARLPRRRPRPGRGRTARALPDRRRRHPGADVSGPGPGDAQSEQCAGGGRARLQHRPRRRARARPHRGGRGAVRARRGSLRRLGRARRVGAREPAPPAARRARAPASRTTWAFPWASPARTWRAARFFRPRSSGRIWRWPAWRPA